MIWFSVIAGLFIAEALFAVIGTYVISTRKERKAKKDE